MANDNKPLAVTVATHKDKRHNQQNRLYWQYLNQIAEQAMIEGKKFNAECWHEFFKMQFLGMVDLPNGHKIGESTTKLNVTDFASYVNNIEAYAVTELGVIFGADNDYK